MKHFFLTLDLKIFFGLLTCVLIGLALGLAVAAETERNYRKARRGLRRENQVSYYITNTISSK